MYIFGMCFERIIHSIVLTCSRRNVATSAIAKCHMLIVSLYACALLFILLYLNADDTMRLEGFSLLLWPEIYPVSQTSNDRRKSQNVSISGFLFHYRQMLSRTNYGKFNIRFFGAKVWNSIEESLKSKSRTCFKILLKESLISNY